MVYPRATILPVVGPRVHGRENEAMTRGEDPDLAGPAASMSNDVTETGVFHAVLEGYDAVYRRCRG